jgi:hypothetical protein
MFSSNTTQESGGYEIQRSLRFNSADSANLSRTPSVAGNRKTWTYSTWVKRANLSQAQGILAEAGSDLISFGFAADNIFFMTISGVGNGATTAVFRDPSSWYHVVIRFDTTQATAADRVRIYINNVLQSLSSTLVLQNTDYGINNTTLHEIGRTKYSGPITYLDGYLTEIYMVDGQSLDPSSFGEYNADTGVWQPKRYGGSYGTNGFYLNFSDNSNTTAATLGADYSGNGNNWTPNNFSVTAGAGNDSLVDVPTPYGVDTGVGGEVRGNYCTMNPVNKGSTVTLSNGNLDQVTFDANWDSARASIAVASGKWYWEVTITGTSQLVMHGVDDNTYNLIPNTSNLYVGAYTNSWGVYASTGQKRNNTGTGTAYGSAFAQNDVMMVAMDMDSGKIWWGKNGTWFASGDPVAGTNAAYTNLLGYTLNPATSGFNVGSDCTHNFGQRPFAYTAPSGFKALNTQNLPTPTIGATPATQAGKFFNPVLYTGNNTVRSITGIGFQPDFTWIKRRDPADGHYLFDSVRGATKFLNSDGTNTETTNTFSLTSFDSDGVSLGISNTVNSNTNPFVAWNWKANGAGVTNTAGTITSTVSANTTSGFSVVTYTNASSGTVGHGLGAAPVMVIYKDRVTAGNNWVVLHKSLADMTGSYLTLNTTNAVATGLGLSAAPTSTVISTSTALGGSGNGFVAYCFSEVPGYSKFGSWTGNGSADGPFAYCGFRPAFVMIKSASQSGVNWVIFDTKRSTTNVASGPLFPNASSAEGNSTPQLDILSNGFKWRNTDAGSYPGNVNGDTYIFAAFAEAPQKFALAR